VVIEFELDLSLHKYHVNEVAVPIRQVSCPHIFDEPIFSHVWECCLDIEE